MSLSQRLLGILPGVKSNTLYSSQNRNQESGSARLPMMMFLLLFLVTAYSQSSMAAATTSWEVVASSQVAVKLANPVRNRRSSDATVDINLSNVSAQTLAGPFRLIITGLTPADKVSIGNATGNTDAGEPYYDLTGYIGTSFTPAGTGVVNVIVKGGGPNIFSFNTRIERQITQSQALTIKITSPATLLTVGSTPQIVKGTVSDPAAQVTLNGAPVTNSNGSFEAAVTLDEGHNTISARAVDAQGEDVTDTISLSLDMTPPYLTVESPKDGDTVRTNKIAVSGLINDIVRGTVAEGQAIVTVNGKAASISNRSYLAEDITLNEGDNTLKIDGADNVGNTSSISIKVNYLPLAPQHIEVLSGQDQTAKINTTLGAPLKVKLLDDKKQPVANKPVIFRVTEGDGVVGAGSQDQGQGTLVQTDAQGVAATPFKLGARAGTGNQRVRATSVGFDGEVLFYASATVSTGNKVTVNSGNNQRGALSQTLPQPFVVAVIDEGANVVPGAQVEFKVTQGSGKFQNGLTSITSTTDSDGRATAELTLGAEEGLDVHRATATLVGTELYAGFTASALKTGAAGQTSISGVVLDNQDKPLPKVTVRVDGTTREAQSDAQGQFKITEAPVGSVRLIADGSTTTAEGEWPTLAFNLVTIAGAENPLAAPIYLVKLDTVNAKQVGDQDVTLTLPDVPGFALEVKAGSVTFPDGKKTGRLSVTPVNASKIPMSPPNGMQPQFIVTIQPVGAKFDPPAKLSLPNVDGHKPGAAVEMYSYDHDLEEFVSIGLGTVNAEGSVIKSNQGVGVIKAGWHCGSQPGGAGCAAGLKECQKCEGNCVIGPDPAKNDQCCGGGSSICKTGSCTPVKLDSADGKVNGKEEDVVAFKTGGTSVNFTGTATGSNCDYEYKWDFGDGQSDTTQNPAHTYANPGEYNAKLTVKCKKCGPGEKTDTVKVYVVQVELVTPKGDPVAAPKNSGDGQNEFTFNNASPGVLTVNFKAKVTPNTVDLNKVKDKVFFTVANVGSAPTWDGANPGGKSSVSGTDLVAKASFSGLPANNADFGIKNVELKFDGNVIESPNVEVFFNRDATNHPGGQAGSPNWFHYWLEAIGGRANTQYVAALGGNFGETPGMLHWSYTVAQDKTRVDISDVAKTSDSGDACASGGKKMTTGIDTFEDTVLHENHHTVQVAAADAVVGIVAGSPWRYGWSWNQGAHNHWSLGADGKPGVTGVDDDTDGTIDNYIVTGPGELGNGDDAVLHDMTAPAQEWPTAFGALPPLCWATGFAIEDAAYDKEPDNEDGRLAVDWGDPGKQHLTKSAND